MNEPPDDLDQRELRAALRAWGIEDGSLTYLPVGFGDHHWTAADGGGRRWFLTVADLAHKHFLGGEPATVLRRLRQAMDTAAALKDRARLDFVVAPLPDAGGGTVRPLDARYALSVFPFVEGPPGRFGEASSAPERARVLELLARLHRTAPPPSTPVARPELPLRPVLERALAEVGQPWRGGPFAEPASDLLAAVTSRLHRQLGEFDRLVEQVYGGGPELAVTHGEPHPGNLLRVGDRRLLVDWDTVGLAVPERDLWSVATGPDDLARYADAAGRRPDPAALALYRLRWALDDVTIYVGLFRAPHDRTPDTELAWQGLSDSLEKLTAPG